MPSELPQRRPKDPASSLESVIDRLRARRGWIIALGILSTVLGLAALVLAEVATIASVLVIGVFMVLAGIVEVLVGFRTRTWGRMLLWEATGLVYIVAGLFAVALPVPASVVITLMLGAGLLATGILRIVLGAKMGGTRSRGGIVLSGVISALLGLLIVMNWPSSSVVVLGTFLGIDLLSRGIAWIVFGTRLGVHRP